MMNTENLKERLEEFLQTHYDGSFSRMACDYIHATGMTPQDVEDLLEAMRQEKSSNFRRERQRNTLNTNPSEVTEEVNVILMFL